MRILVTGGAGFIGSALVRRLVEEGHQVRVFDDCSRGTRENLHGLNLHFYEGDIRDELAVSIAALSCEEVIHLAYVNGTKTFYDQPDLVLDVGVRGMLNVLAACSKNNIKRLLLASSSEVCRAEVNEMNEVTPLVIPDPFNARYSYSAGKIISEMLAIHSGLFDWLTIVRPFNIYGPGMHLGHAVPDFAKQLKERMAFTNEDPLPFTILGSANETRSFCYIDDLIDGLMLVREHGKHRDVYNIGTPEEVTIGELATRMARFYGRRLSLKQANSLREGSIQRRRPEIDKIRELGYQPKVSLDEGIKRVLCQ
jgi:nucleoside-diphosphate-sugar epimerase